MPKRESFLDATLDMISFGWLWDAITLYWHGKHVAVLGARGVGKSHFIKFLTSGSIPTEYKQTVAPEKAAGRRLQLKDLDLKIKNMLDVGGGTEARAQWSKQVARANIVFYLLRADQMITGDAAVEERVLSDANHLKDWLQIRKPRPALCIVGTHCDNDAKFCGVLANRYGDYVQSFRELPKVKRLLRVCGGESQVSLVVGSMKTLGSTEELVFAVFNTVMAEQ